MKGKYFHVFIDKAIIFMFNVNLLLTLLNITVSDVTIRGR